MIQTWGITQPWLPGRSEMRMALLCNLAMDLAILFYTTQLAYANLGWHPQWQVEIIKFGPQLQEIYANISHVLGGFKPY